MSLFNPSRRKTRLTVADETPTSTAICLPVQRCRRSRSIFSITAWGVGRCSRCGRDERSCNPANPSRRYRSTHLRTVRGKTPALRRRPPASARSRPAVQSALSSGVSRAFLSTFARSSRESLKPRNSSFLGQARMNNLMKAHRWRETPGHARQAAAASSYRRSKHRRIPRPS